jgi:ABC-type glutathione transport system ATPase component
MHTECEFAVEARGVCKTYEHSRWWHKPSRCRALDNVNLTLRSGQTLGLIGQSGSGKTTLAMCLVGLERPDAGELFINGTKIETSARKKQGMGCDIQLIFQDSSGALNPRMSALEIVEEPLLIRGEHTRAERGKLANEILDRVGIPSQWLERMPREFSGGQRQRLAIARALVLQPKVLILDEVFVGLDLSIRGQIANLLLDLQESRGLSYLCISHNLGLVGQFAETIAVMDRGRIVETGTTEQVIDRLERTSPGALNTAPRKSFGARSGA